MTVQPDLCARRALLPHAEAMLAGGAYQASAGRPTLATPWSRKASRLPL
jgi:hypothetical protein